jgi:hypothetical protein
MQDIKEDQGGEAVGLRGGRVTEYHQSFYFLPA